jgi:hypothetical protein
METLVFHMARHNYVIHIFNSLISGVKQLVCKAIFETSIMQVRGECSTVANMFVLELYFCIVDFELVNVIGIMYP